MAVDKNLFLYDLAVVSMIKNEAPYVKEWLDYHLLAGVDHFFIYDNESTDNLREVLQPYIDAGVVTYAFFPGGQTQLPSFNEALQKYKFFCRYMTFLDGDEFILPKSNKSIVEVADEIFSASPNIGSLEIIWQLYGSNFNETADYSKGVLERFTRRAENNERTNPATKCIVDPRKVKLFATQHCAVLSEFVVAVNETGKVQQRQGSISPPLVDKIVVNHYHCKSWEEYQIKVKRGSAFYTHNIYDRNFFNAHDRNDVYDDSILKYRAARFSALVSHSGKGGGYEVLENFTAKKNIDYEKIMTRVFKNLLPLFNKNLPAEFFVGKMETFLTCRALIKFFSGKLLDESRAKFLEELALDAIYKCTMTNISVADFRLLLAELPEILKLNYPAVKDIRSVCIKIIPQLQRVTILYGNLKDFTELDYILKMLELLNSEKS